MTGMQYYNGGFMYTFYKNEMKFSFKEDETVLRVVFAYYSIIINRSYFRAKRGSVLLG